MASTPPKRRTKAPATTAVAAAAAHAFRGLADWIEVFYAGDHTNSKGQAVSFSTADLDQMVANVALGKPPAVLGHPKHNDRAYGWADLKRDGESLFAKFSDLNPGFVASVDSGAYRNRSVFVVKDKQHGWRVRHIGWLGAAPPALDGLQELAYHAGDAEADEAHEFSADDQQVAWALGDVASLLRGLRDWVISKDGVETADRVLPDWTINSLQNAATTLRDQAVAEVAMPRAFSAAGTLPGGTASTPPAGDPNMGLTQDDVQRAAAQARQEATQEAETRLAGEFSAQFSAQTTELQQLRGQRQAERIAAQITAWHAAGLPPAATEGMAEFMAATETGAVEFAFTAAGASAPATQSPSAWFSAWVGKLLPIVKLGERLPPETVGPAVDTTDQHAIARAAREFQASEFAAGRTVGVELAVAHVMRQQAG